MHPRAEGPSPRLGLGPAARAGARAKRWERPSTTLAGDVSQPAPPTPLPTVLVITFLGSVSGGAFWAGIFFVTAEHYGFSPLRNLALAAVMGAIYAVGASRTGAMLRALRRWVSPRAMLAGTLASWGIVSLAPLAARHDEAALWLTAALGALASAVTWPIVESYLSAGRHGGAMRTALGWFNVTWTPAVAVPLLLMPLVARVDILWTIAVSAVVNAAAVALLLARLPPHPGAHAPEAAVAAVGAEYPWLLRSASWLLPLSYVISSTLSPVLPHRLASVGVDAATASPMAAIWMIARFVMLGLMWRTGAWHGRWGTLAAAAAALAGGLALVLLGSTIAAVAAGLALFGAGMALTYYAALYYSLAVGHAEVDAGGTFEALIGLGYLTGPLLGIAGTALAGPAGAGSATVGLTWVVTAAACGVAVRPYLEARRSRR